VFYRNTDAARTFNMNGKCFHDLGGLELELRLACANVNLRLSSEIKLATIRDDVSDAATLDFSPVERLVDSHGCRKPWVVKSHGYQLVVDLHIGTTLELEDEAFAQKVAAQLKHSKARNGVYSQLEHANMPVDLVHSWTRSDRD